MVRKKFHLTAIPEDAYQVLKYRAERLGLPISVCIRRMIYLSKIDDDAIMTAKVANTTMAATGAAV